MRSEECYHSFKVESTFVVVPSFVRIGEICYYELLSPIKNGRYIISVYNGWTDCWKMLDFHVEAQ